MAEPGFREDMKQFALSALADIANSYQDLLIRGHLMPSRDLSLWIAEEEYEREHAVPATYSLEAEPPDSSLQVEPEA